MDVACQVRHRRPPLRPRGGWPRRTPPAAAASGVGSLVETTAAALATAALAASAWPLLAGTEAPPRGAQPPPEQSADDGLAWSVAGLVSALPYASPLAWVGLALTTGRSRFWGLAALYALPYAAAGLEPDRWTAFALLLGVAQLQAGRPQV